MRVCRISGCERPRHRYVPFCAARQKRKDRYGSPTARRCIACRKTVDDDDTARIEHRPYLCGRCLSTRFFCSVPGCRNVANGKKGSRCSKGHPKIERPPLPGLPKSSKPPRVCRCRKCLETGSH